MTCLDPQTRVYVAGHRGMVGSAVVRALRACGCHQILTRERSQLDLTDSRTVRDFFEAERPDVAVIAAAKVGGIHANDTYPAEFAFENLAIATHTIDAAYRAGTRRLLFLGSSCIYPRDAAQPMQEDCLLTGPLEKTNEAYAIAKIAGLKLCQYYRRQYGVLFHSAMPTNLYGPGDNYHPENSHVMPALIRRFHEARESGAREVVLWGTGRPRREFLHVDDCANGILHLLSVEQPPDWVNLGAGDDVPIVELAEIISRIVGYQGKLVWDTSRPDGTPRKLMDGSRMKALGWHPSFTLEDGIRNAYHCFLQERAQGTLRE